MAETEYYQIANVMGTNHYDIISIAKNYDLKIFSLSEHGIVVRMNKNELLDIQESYPGIGIQKFKEDTSYLSGN